MLFFDNAGPARVVVGWSPVLTEAPAGGVVVPIPSQTPSQPGEPGSSPTPLPGTTAVPTQPGGTPTSTDTPGPSPTPTSTGTPGPSPTPTSTGTPGPSPTPTSTGTPGPSPTPTSTGTPGPSPRRRARARPVPRHADTHPDDRGHAATCRGPESSRRPGRYSGGGEDQWPVVTWRSGRGEPAAVWGANPGHPVKWSPPGQSTTSSNGTPVETQFRIPNNPLLVAHSASKWSCTRKIGMNGPRMSFTFTNSV